MSGELLSLIGTALLAGVGLCLLVAWAIVLAGAIGALRR